MKVSICSEASISDSRQALEKGGVWLVVEIDGQSWSHYLNPNDLISWIEGGSIRDVAIFEGLHEDYRENAHNRFEAELRKVVQ